MSFYLSLLDKISLLEQRIEEKKLRDSHLPWYLKLSQGSKTFLPWFIYTEELPDKLKLRFYKTLLALTRILMIVKGTPSSNFHIFTQAGKEGIYICNYNYCYYKNFHKKTKWKFLAMVTAATIIVSLIVALVFPGKPYSKAATYPWIQTDWSGGLDSPPPYPNDTDQRLNGTPWTKYSAKDANIAPVLVGADQTLQLTAATGSTTDNTFTGGTSSQTQVNNSLAGSWHLNGGTSGNIANGATAGFTDSSGNGNNGTFYNANNSVSPTTTWISGPTQVPSNGGAVKFDGVDDYVSIPNSSSFNTTNTITLGAWINATNFSASGGYNFIVSKYGDAATFGSDQPSYLLDVKGTANAPRLTVYTTSSTASNVTFLADSAHCGSADPTLTAGQWYYVAGTYDGNLTMHIYIWNGTSLITCTNTLASPTTIYVGTAPVDIGDLHGHNGSYNFTGSIDEVRVYNRALEQSEITDLYTNATENKKSVELDYDYGGGTGADGPLTIAASYNINTDNISGATNTASGKITGRTTADAVNFSTTGTISATNTAITLSSTPTGLSVGDEIIIINLKDKH